ncbi:MAG: hypothetical protein AAF632_16370 [Bacteroidota bacterium]
MLKSLTNSTPLGILLAWNALTAGIAGFYFATGLPPWLMALIGAILGSLATFTLYIFFLWLGKLGRQLPLKLVAAVLGSAVGLVIIKETAFRWPDQVYYPAMLIAILFCLTLYFSISKLAIRTQSILAWSGVGATLIFLAISTFWLQREGTDPFVEENLPPFTSVTVPTLSDEGLTSPATSGKYSVKAFTYGSGNDQHRTEYAEGVTYTTSTVDATRLLPDWKGKKKKWRERYWDFGVENFPLNGRVYMPEGEGAFPLILIVHGNHSMIDYSDDGYGYLGKLLASRGFITVSVDENFINGHWSGDFRGKEMPVRAWLLLKHIEQWQSWNNTAGHDLTGKADLNKIILVGHSRGGEAVSIAAAYNMLPNFPDDVQEVFDFNFGIQGVVSIAPTDYRYHRQITLEDVNYLSLQGSYDADEASFWGMRPYRRLNFSDSSQRFKAGVYLHRANHGQFNTTWGRSDFGGTMSWLLNTEPMMSGEEQQQAAQVFIAAFAEATLHQDRQYLPLFKNIAVARDWLPEQYYLTHYQDANAIILVDFEDDINVATAGKSAIARAENFIIWREENLSTRTQGSQENSAVVLGWDYGTAINTDSLARYELTLNDTTFVSSAVDSLGSMQISIAAADFKELDRQANGQESRDEPEVDMSIWLTDQVGQRAQIPVSSIKPIAPRLKTRFTKLAFLDKDMIGNEWEVQLQTFHLPLATFQANNPTFNIQKLRKISLVFDQNPYGVVVIDDIGFSP